MQCSSLLTFSLLFSFALVSLGCNGDRSASVTLSKTPAISEVEFRLASDTYAEGMASVDVSKEVTANHEKFLFVARKPFLTGIDIASAKQGIDAEGQHCILVEFTADGREALFDATINARGKRVAMMRAGKVLWAPHITDPINSQFISISGGLSAEECKSVQKSMTNPEYKN